MGVILGMPRNRREEKKLLTVVIVHGKSERAICNNVRTNLKIVQKEFARVNGRSSIQITGLMKELKSGCFANKRRFQEEYSTAFDGRQLHEGFKLFIIMDVDDCPEEQKEAFKDKSMFLGHWLYDYIVPIYNEPNLEQTMSDIGIGIDKHNKSKYEDVFPIVQNGKNDPEKIKRLYDQLKDCKRSNLDVYVKHRLDVWKMK